MTENIVKEDKNPFRKIFNIIIAINILAIIGIIFLQNKLPPEVPLFYGLPEGENQLVKTIFLTIPPIVTLFFSLVNLLISSFFKDKFVKEVLIYSLIFLSFFSLVTIIKIALLVGNII
jgi:hypothetical protein